MRLSFDVLIFRMQPPNPQFNSNPAEPHIKTARYVLRYLKGTKDYCIVYGNS